MCWTFLSYLHVLQQYHQSCVCNLNVLSKAVIKLSDNVEVQYYKLTWLMTAAISQKCILDILTLRMSPSPTQMGAYDV